MMMTATKPSTLFACVKCHQRYPFEELSSGDMVCKECRQNYPKVKCTYCRNEFKQASKNLTTSICEKCDQFVKSYGKPKSCDYCNVLAAFIGKKCQTCTNSEKRWGSPVECYECRQTCAFRRQQSEKHTPVLCYLCTKLKSKVKSRRHKVDASITDSLLTPSSRTSRKSDAQGDSFMLPPMEKKTKWLTHTSNSIVNSLQVEKRNRDLLANANSSSSSIAGVGAAGIMSSTSMSSSPTSCLAMSNSTDSMAEIARLQDRAQHLRDTIAARDKTILEKDQMITHLKADKFELDKTMRARIETATKELSDSVTFLKDQNRDLHRQLKSKKK